ncbi:serine hydrolase domain-containing protein [Streptomyces cadmiisoli]|uniref:serine hydrolase domain-containing protein n=1 Tax=Streptomyces cadmiisoli TaxID=2184053 RepID=UPI003D72224E
MRFSSLVTVVVASAALAAPLTAPATASPAGPPVAVTEKAGLGDPDHGRERARYGGRGRELADARLQSVLDEVVASGAVGVVAEVRDADGVWKGRSGMGDIGRAQPPRTDGRFRAGSVTKSFVATTVLQLVAEGRLRLDEPVERHLPGLVPDGERITVRHLLGHRSGLFDYTDGMWPGGLVEMHDTRFRRLAPHELVAEANRHEPGFAAGTAGRYSNTNYVLLGMLIQKITGNPAEQEMMRRIVRPLGLRGTSFPGASTGIPGPNARAYVRLQGPDSGYTDMTKSDMSWAWTAGALISTTRDLNTFYKALIDGKLLSAEMLAQMKDARKLEDGGLYGLGMTRLDSPAFGTAYGHTGNTPGFTTQSYTLGDGSRQVTLSINSMPATKEEMQKTTEAATALLGIGTKAR